MSEVHTHQIVSLDTIDDEDSIQNWKFASYSRPKTLPGMVSLFWKNFERENANGQLVQEFDYIYSKDYIPEYTYGVILKDEIDSVIARLRHCPEYNLHPDVYSRRELSHKICLLVSFAIFCLAWVSLTVCRGYVRLLSFLLLNIVFLMVFVMACARMSNNRG